MVFRLTFLFKSQRPSSKERNIPLIHASFASYHLSKAPHDWGSWVNLKILCGCCRFPTLSLSLSRFILPNLPNHTTHTRSDQNPLQHSFSSFIQQSSEISKSSHLNLCLQHTEMGFSTHKLFILLSCIGFLAAVQAQRVTGLNSIDLALKAHFPFLRRPRILEQADGGDMVNAPIQALGPSVAFNPDQSSKRRIRRGWDPIHNKCWGAVKYHPSARKRIFGKDRVGLLYVSAIVGPKTSSFVIV